MSLISSIKNVRAMMKAGDVNADDPKTMAIFLEKQIADKEVKLKQLDENDSKVQTLEQEIEKDKRTVKILQNQENVETPELSMSFIIDWIQKNNKFFTSSGVAVSKDKKLDREKNIIISVVFLDFAHETDPDAPNLEIKTKKLAEDLIDAFADKNMILISGE